MDDEIIVLQRKDGEHVNDSTNAGRRAVSDGHLRGWQTKLRQGWAVHFIVTLFLVLYAIYKNGGVRKYIPANPSQFPSCDKAFLNVLASSKEEVLAIVCCNGDSSNVTLGSLCGSKSIYLPFADRLARFPDAWLLPLFPMMFRLVFAWMSWLFRSCWESHERFSTMLLRLSFYVATLSFRGWFLYVLLNRLESLVMIQPDEECWYENLIHTPSCYGRIFDFSDHTVLYMAQILPLPLMETLHALALPFWGKTISPDAVLLAFLVYLYFITLLGEFKTAAHFHTAGEIIAGYGVSLFVQIPYAILQCSTRWEGIRMTLFGYPPSNSRRD